MHSSRACFLISETIRSTDGSHAASIAAAYGIGVSSAEMSTGGASNNSKWFVTIRATRLAPQLPPGGPFLHDGKPGGVGETRRRPCVVERNQRPGIDHSGFNAVGTSCSAASTAR